jgi:hypothetical protein
MFALPMVKEEKMSRTEFQIVLIDSDAKTGHR